MEITRQEAKRARSKLEVQKVAETEECSVQWTIPNWKKVRMDEATVNSQKITFDSSQYGKWEIGLKAIKYADGSNRARVYLKLVEIYGNSKQLDVTISIDVLNSQGEEVEGSYDETQKVLGLNAIIEENEGFLDVLTTSDEDDPFIHSDDGSVKYSLTVTTKLCASNKRKMHTKEFSRKSFKNMCDNQASLLTNDANADLKFATRDGIELRAHKAVLMAQCPVFAGMLGTEFREATSGVIKLDDISAKTMNILLHYFYTGSLLPSWCDKDTILEFVYAAGKYQMNLILDLLDKTLGMDHQQETCYIDVQILNLSEKLSLKGAEGRLLQRVVEKVKNVKESKDLLDLFGYDNEGIAKMANLTGNEIIEESNFLEVIDTLMGDQENIEEKRDMGKICLQVLAVVQRKNENGKLENLKKMLLGWCCKTAAKFTSAAELFNFFGYENL